VPTTAPPRSSSRPRPGATSPDEDTAVFILAAVVLSVIALAIWKLITSHPFIAATAVAMLLAVAVGGLVLRARSRDRLAARSDPKPPGLIIGTVRGGWLGAQQRPFFLPWSAFTRHVLIDGPTGSGKTFTFIDPILRAHVARKQTGVFYLDGKGERIDQPTEAGPGVKFDAVFAPENPATSACWNPLAGPDPVAAAAAFAAALFPETAGAGANFYEHRGFYTVSRVAAAMSLTGVGVPGMWPDDAEITSRLVAAGIEKDKAEKLVLKPGRAACLQQLSYLEHRDEGADLHALISRQAKPAQGTPVWPAVCTVTVEQLFRVLFRPGGLDDLHVACADLAKHHPDPAMARRLSQYAGDLAALTSASAKDRATQLANLQNRLAPFLESPFLELCSKDELRISDVCAGRSVAFLLPTGRYDAVAQTLGRLVLAQFRQAVLASQPGITKLAVLDEFHNFVSPDWIAFLNQARSKGGGAVMAVQSIATFDQDIRDGMLANVATVIVTPGCQPLDADHWSKAFGEVPTEHVSYTHEPRQPMQPRRPPSMRVEDRDRPRFTPTEIAELDKGSALIRTVDGRKDYAPTVVDVERGP